MRELAGMRDLDAWYSHDDAASLGAELRRQHDGAAKTLEHAEVRARANDNVHELAKLTHVVEGEPRIVSDPPLVVPIAELERGGCVEARLREAFESYLRSLPSDRRVLLERFRYGDLARKVVGIGSVGRRCWIVLLLGRDEQDPLFLQVKEAQASVLEPFLGRSAFGSHARRIVEGQRLSQAAGDIFLGWARAQGDGDGGRDFYVRQLRDWKVSIDVERIKPARLATYARWCGATLAKAYARSGDRIAIAAYLGKGDSFDEAVAAFARAYAELNERDHATLRDAVRGGRLSATKASSSRRFRSLPQAIGSPADADAGWNTDDGSRDETRC